MAIGVLKSLTYGAYRVDVGYCDSMPNPDVAGAEQMAIKGAVTDALKRCASSLGHRLGLALRFQSEERATLGLSPEGEDLEPGRRPENHAPTPPVPARPTSTAAYPATSPPAISAPAPDAETEARLDGYRDDQPIAKELANALVAIGKRAGKKPLELFQACGVVPPNPPTGAQARLYLKRVKE